MSLRSLWTCYTVGIGAKNRAQWKWHGNLTRSFGDWGIPHDNDSSNRASLGHSFI